MNALAAPQPRCRLVETIDAYLDQIAVSLRPLSVESAANILGRFTEVISELDPSVIAVADITRAEPRPLTRLVVEMLARTGMRVSELCALEADAVVRSSTDGPRAMSSVTPARCPTR